MKKTRLVIAAALAVAVAVPALTYAQSFSKPENAIKYRKSALTVMATHFGTIGAVVKGDKPFVAAEVAAAASIVETMAPLPWAGFIAGTDSGDTKAKPEVWSQADKFKEAQTALIKATAELSAAAKTGQEAAVKTAFANTGKACKGCHDNFRKE